MKLVIDNNIFFSLMNPKSTNSYIFSSLKVEFLAPKFIKSEFDKYRLICLLKSKLSEHEFEIRQAEIEEDVELIKLSEYKDFIKKSLNTLPDKDDVDFLALALRLNCSIWSNDSHFEKQSLVKVFKTKDLVKLLLNNKL